MYLSVHELIDLEELPSEEQLTLQTIAQFYEEHLCNLIFHYKIRHKKRGIRLHFRTFDLLHLLCIHKMETGSSYRGKKGFPKLRQGTLTLEMLKKANLGGYERTIYRI
ncbi:PBECR4 domain-containing protein [Paenibacillus sp. CMM36]|jgi:hypothetical protein